MNFQVESLKVLVTRQVVMNRMDYSTYLNGTVKDELDRLDRLEGKYRIQGSKLTIEGLHQDDWEYFKECLGNRVPMGLVNVIEGKEGFTISESKNGQRTWIISDMDGWKNRELLKSRGYLKLQRSGRHPTWNHFDYFIEDGWLVNTQKGWDHQDYHDMNNGKMELALNLRDSITVNNKGSVLRTFMWSAPNQDLKVTKVMRAIKVLEGQGT